MAFEHTGEICALLAAVSWASALVLFKISGESMSPLSLNLFKNVVGVILLWATMPLIQERAQATTPLGVDDFCILIASGIIGIAIADTLLFYALRRIGVGLLSIAECSYAPLVVVFALLMLGEQIESRHYLGGALVLSGVIVASTHAPPPGLARKDIVSGLLLAVISTMLMAFGIVWVKPILERTALVEAAFIRLAGGTVVLAGFMALSPQRAKLFSVFRPSQSWKTAIPASVFGTYFAMLFWVGGFKYTKAGIAAVLNQTSTILAFILASIFLHERLSRRKIIAVVLALAGVLVVTLLKPDEP